MTIERDLDFRVAAWLDDRATSTVPDRLLERSLSRVAVTRQRPGWLVRGAGRDRIESPLSLRLVALGAAAVALAAIWIGSMGGGPRPAPSPSPTASPGTSPVPQSLRATWVGPTRTPPPELPGVVQYALNLSIGQLQFYGGGEPILRSNASWLGDNRLAFRLSQDEAGCHRDDLGTYAFALNQTNRALTLNPESDACAARSTLVTGDWARADCPNRNSLCLGDLDAGQHASAQFNPFVPRDAYVYDYGRLSYTVPDGWTNSVDGPDGFSLVEQAAPESGAINLSSTAMADSQAAGCPGTLETGVGRSAAALSSWLTSLPGVTATTPASTSVGGLNGYTLDLTLEPSWTRTCPFSSGKAYVALFTNNDAVNNFDWGMAAGNKVRVFLLDLPDGRAMLIHLDVPDEATWDAFVADAMPIIETFAFHP